MKQLITAAERQSYPGYGTDLLLDPSLPFEDWFPRVVHGDPTASVDYLNGVANRLVELLASIPEGYHPTVEKIAELMNELLGN